MAVLYPPDGPYDQLQQGDPNGSKNCAAYGCAAGVWFDSQGHYTPSGRNIRAWSSEPVPDPKSPGLNLMQLGDVILRHYSMSLDVHLGMAWGDAMAALAAGHGLFLSIGYDPIRRSAFRGSRLFRMGHMLFVMPGRRVIDPLADGRPLGDGVHAYDGPGVYPEQLLKEAAGQLPIKISSTGVVLARAGYGKAWVGILPTPHPIGSGPAPQPPGPGVVLAGPQFKGGDMAIARGGLRRIDSGYVLALAKGQPLFQQAGSSDVRTRMSAAARVPYVGVPSGGGWYSVEVSTGSRYADGKQRPTILYVPAAVGKPEEA